MHCLTCDCTMVSTCSQVVEDEKNAMTITQWHCRSCHETSEEIWLSAGYRGPDPMVIRYTVSLQPTPQASVAARTRVKGGTYAYAGAI